MNVSNSFVIADKISMYEAENQRIEEKVLATVASYMEYEEKTFEGLKNESAIELVSLFPELKSDTLINKQIEVYLENNQKIKELKETQINYSVNRWWLYFGG